MKTRSQKLDFLKGLIRGTRSLKEIAPFKVWCLREYKENRGIYIDDSTGIEYTTEDLNRIKSENIGRMIILTCFSDSKEMQRLHDGMRKIKK